MMRYWKQRITITIITIIINVTVVIIRIVYTIILFTISIRIIIIIIMSTIHPVTHSLPCCSPTDAAAPSHRRRSQVLSLPSPVCSRCCAPTYSNFPWRPRRVVGV